jgi:hypothetical protein
VSLNGDVLFDLSIFVYEFDSAVCKSNCEGLANALGEGHPVVVDGVGVEFKPLGALACGGVPSINKVVVTYTVCNKRYLVSSLKEHHDTEVQISSWRV